LRQLAARGSARWGERAEACHVISRLPVTDALEAELDRLFGLPSAELIAARAALVDRLRKAGDKAGAARVKAVRRPTPAAWALNQLHFHQPELLTRARDASDEVRALHAQDGVEPRALSAALVSQRATLHEVVEAALKRCEAVGVPSSAAHQRKLLATLQAVLSGAHEEGFGRLTRDLEPGGFDAIAVVGSAAAPGPGPRVPSAARSPAREQTLIKAGPAVDDERMGRARAALREQELSVHEAHKSVQQGRAELANALREKDSAEARVREAEAALLALRNRLSTRASEHARLQIAVDEAIAREAHARAGLEQARAELASLEPKPGMR
jgi:hypothetical protein